MMMINDLIDIKAKNAKCILNTLRFHDMLTKKDIAEMTELSFATVSNLSNELKTMGILVDTKVGEKRVGRSPNALTLNYRQYLTVTLDLQLENTLGFAVVNLQNEVIEAKAFDTADMHTAQELVRFAREVFDGFLLSHSQPDVRFIGIGAAVPAVYDSNDGKLVLSAVPLFEDVPLKNMLSEAFGLPAYVDNIANISALSVYTRRANQDNIICLDISQGVGVGVISDGNLLRGNNGYATEVAHVPIGNPELRCPLCGGYGCVETELSIAGMVKYCAGDDSALPLLQRWKLFVDKMAGDTEESAAIARHIGALTGKLATILINLFDPQVFYVTGYITEVFGKLEPYFYNEIQQRCKMSLSRGLKIAVDEDVPQNMNIYIGLCDALYNGWNPLSANDSK